MSENPEAAPGRHDVTTDDGTTLHALAEGEGPVLLVLCSMGAACHRAQTPAALADRFRLVHLDLRGSGGSGGDPGTLDFDRLAADLDAVLAALGAERAILFGHSILGMLALEAARRRPRAVSHVVAVGTPPIGDMARVSAAADQAFEEEASEERKRALAESLAALPPDAPPGARMMALTAKRFFDPEFDASVLLAGAVARPGFFEHLLGPLAAGWDVLCDPRPIGAPVLLAHGRADFTVPLRLWDGVAERLPDVTLRVFERSGHQPFVEEPERFVEVLDEWLASRAAG